MKISKTSSGAIQTKTSSGKIQTKTSSGRTLAEEKKSFGKLFVFLRIIQFFLFPVRAVSLENVPLGGARILCANHWSDLDSVLLALSLTRKLHPHFMAKIEMSRVPIIGRLVLRIGSFYVDRKAKDISAVRTALSYLRRGELVMIFPEGRRVSREDSSAAKIGAVRLAAQTGAPIIPAYIARKKRLFRENLIIFGEPYYIDKAETDFEKLSRELLEKIYSLEPQK